MKATLNKTTKSQQRLNDEVKKNDFKSFDDKTATTSTKTSINPLHKHAPNPIDANFQNYSSTSADHETKRGRNRTKLSLTSRKLFNQVDNPNINYHSLSSSKYRSISCEDARQALNESLIKVSTMQNMLETRR